MRVQIFQKFVDLCRFKISFAEFIYFFKKSNVKLISLGYNCEVSQRIKDLTLDNFPHYIYTWAYIHDRLKFLDSLSHLSDFTDSEYELLPNKMILNKRFQIAFHSRFKEELIKTNGNYEMIYSKALKELTSRIGYLANKTEKLFQEKSEDIVFVIKIKHIDFDEDKNFILKLNNILESKYNKTNTRYKLVAVISEKQFKDETEKFCAINAKNLFIHSIKYFAADSKTETDGDIDGWLRILKIYYL